MTLEQKVGIIVWILTVYTHLIPLKGLYKCLSGKNYFQKWFLHSMAGSSFHYDQGALLGYCKTEECPLPMLCNAPYPVDIPKRESQSPNRGVSPLLCPSPRV